MSVAIDRHSTHRTSQQQDGFADAALRHYPVRRIQETLVVAQVVLLVGPGGEPEIGLFRMPVLINWDAVQLDVPISDNPGEEINK